MIDHVDQTSFQIVFVLTSSSSLLSNLSGHFYNSKLQANMRDYYRLLLTLFRLATNVGSLLLDWRPLLIRLATNVGSLLLDWRPMLAPY